MTDQTIETPIQSLKAPEENAGTQNSIPSPSGSFEPIQFTGTTSDYFAIWLSNLLLSIITLGIYSAWAKVRRIGYFYYNTQIRDVGFLYHATGGQIFKGRLMVFVILVAYSMVETFIPFIALAALPIFLIAMPSLINKSMRFNARMTSWRNIRLDWHGTYWKTFFFTLIAPLLSLLSLGLLLPLISRRYYEYYANEHSFGITRFKAETETSKYYAAFFMGAVLPAIPIFAAVSWFSYEIYHMSDSVADPSMMSLIIQGPIIALVILFFIVASIYGSLCRNILLQSLVLGNDAKFTSTIKPWTFVWILISNFVVVIATIGLMSPWAAIRQYKYLADNTHYQFLTDEHQFMDKKREEMSAFGEEFADWEGWEMSI